ncbi:GNAT family N-acetyltransferase [Rhodanobacter glycinis]|uniref:GNAT family N-acetyltransferase n=1 Tax=Rhodanobacter glycinis TaxID=582702 RepID=UPI0013759C3D|nr:GNAT family N-acetyltransferase [Rhodanobacter glycinis]
MITFAVEPWSSFRHDAGRLWVKHWEEVAVHQDVISLNVDYDQYDRQDAYGALYIIVARHKGEIVGYWAGLIRAHLHYADSLTAYTDVYFVEKEYRKRGVGQDLFAFVEKMLKARGVQRIFTATKLHLNHSALFKAAGYNETEIVFTKLLGD